MYHQSEKILGLALVYSGGMATLEAPNFGRGYVVQALSRLETPRSHKSVWIGPFDQLVSAAYALLQADSLEFEKRSTEHYYPNVHRRIVKSLTEDALGEPCSSPQALRDFRSGIYFNAGVQRLTFAAERLIITFAGTPCTCKMGAEIAFQNRSWPKLADCRAGAERRLTHVADHYDKEFVRFRELLNQLKGWDTRSLRADKALAILRRHVNQRKHGIYLRDEWAEAVPKDPAGQKKWSGKEQMELALGAFGLVCDAYSELLAWNPTA